MRDVRACTICKKYLPLGPRPVLQIHPKSRVLIAGQAPGKKAHKSGIPFDDASGNRLREWMGIFKEVFYDPEKIAILPMGFCYPDQEIPEIFPRGRNAHLLGDNNCLSSLPI